MNAVKHSTWKWSEGNWIGFRKPEDVSLQWQKNMLKVMPTFGNIGTYCRIFFLLEVMRHCAPTTSGARGMPSTDKLLVWSMYLCKISNNLSVWENMAFFLLFSPVTRNMDLILFGSLFLQTSCASSCPLSLPLVINLCLVVCPALVLSCVFLPSWLNSPCLHVPCWFIVSCSLSNALFY